MVVMTNFPVLDKENIYQPGGQEAQPTNRPSSQKDSANPAEETKRPGDPISQQIPTGQETQLASQPARTRRLGDAANQDIPDC